ncbi:MAG: Uma2 family endonuclease [Dehalococcoidia bacterium]
MPVTVETYERVALEDPEGNWELVCGQLRRKPGMTMRHNTVSRLMHLALTDQLPRDDWDVAANMARVRVPDGSHYIPDVVVIPIAAKDARGWDSTGLEAYEPAVPFVAEVWSPSTGEYDAESKVPGYMARGDREIWFVDLRDQTIRRHVRQPDGGYQTSHHRRGRLVLASLPGVTLDMDAIFRQVRL